MKGGIVIAAGVALGFLTAQTPVAAQPEESHLTYLDVTATPHRNGDVDLTIISSEEAQSSQPDGKILSQLTRETLPCDWRGLAEEPGYVIGTCHHLLASDGNVVNASLQTASLVTALESRLHIPIIQVIIYFAERTSPKDAEIAIPAGWKPVPDGSTKTREFLFDARDGRVPPPFPIQLGQTIDAGNLLTPILIVLFVPPLLASALRLRPDGIMWMNWILLGAILYWLSSAGIEDMAALGRTLFRDWPVLAWLLSSIIFCLPPILSLVSCLFALSTKGAPRELTARQIKAAVAGNVAILAPLGLLLLGSRTGFLMGSMLGAYLCYAGLHLLETRWSYSEVSAIARGEFFEQVMAIAGKAGATVRSVGLMRSTSPSEANAFATSTGGIMVTESLLGSLSRREVDAVVAHEAGHLAGKHIRFKQVVFWVSVLSAGPLTVYLYQKTGAPMWFQRLPVTSLFLTWFLAVISQRHEFDADARAARVTGDPEAKIAALGRLAQLTNSPLHWGGIQGSILSHPSMRTRVLAIARKFNVPEERALALVANPDLLEQSAEKAGAIAATAGAGASSAAPIVQPSRFYPFPSELLGPDPVFSQKAVIAYVKLASFLSTTLRVLLPVLVSFLFSAWAGYHVSRGIFLAYLATWIPLFWFYCFFNSWRDRRFYRTMERGIGDRVSRPPNAVFVGVSSGTHAPVVEGDLGFLSVEDSRLDWVGERARFSLPASDLISVEILRAPLAWEGVRRVLVNWTGGSFSIGFPASSNSKRSMRELHARLTELLHSETGEVVDSADPQVSASSCTSNLPDLPAGAPRVSRGTMWFRVMMMTGKLYLLTMLVLSLHTEINRITAFAPVCAAFLYALYMIPLVLRMSRSIEGPTGGSSAETRA